MNKISLFLTLLISINLYGNDSLFVSANSDYAKQEYRSAIEKYQVILLIKEELFYKSEFTGASYSR